MAELVPAARGGPLATLNDPAGGSPLERMRSLGAQPAIRRAMPWFLGVAALGALALTYSVLWPAPQRVLYGQLDDAQRADVAAALDKAAIAYQIDNGSGALTVDEGDLYRARMIVASDGALATPESGMELLDNLPLGASRTMEGERLRAARERELVLTIREIDGVEAVRVHLAEPQQSVFVRDQNPPSASVMLRLANGRQLSESQVVAIANLVANSVSGLPVDNVRIVDQHGRLLSQPRSGNATALELQSQVEDKLRAQVSQLLTPILGAGSFSSEIQVDLDMEERTAARESYDKEGVVRQETEESSSSAGAYAAAGGVPGMLSNTPPPPGTAEVGNAQNGPAAAPAGAPQSGETRATRQYELGREVAVSNTGPGRIRRVSVAVALSAEAMKKSKGADVQSFKNLVSAAVGADPARGDQVEVVVRDFAVETFEEPAFYETGWFATIVRYVATLLGLLLVLLIVVRPILRLMRGKAGPAPEETADEPNAETGGPAAQGAGDYVPDAIDRSLLNRQVGAAQKFVDDRPDRAVIAIRQMLSQNQAA
ncbi:MAG: flagellar M-ring protein FliF [Sphingomonadales bacterium 32-68-7]|nr:MAG: flagellar M-ring protein FliF [Sphingomonadales bacterium 12-68-11]OYX10180.1 MAG: flagellar M-ring protein FliF [Sphingomonadales bacterium 32-68-7]